VTVFRIPLLSFCALVPWKYFRYHLFPGEGNKPNWQYSLDYKKVIPRVILTCAKPVLSRTAGTFSIGDVIFSALDDESITTSRDGQILMEPLFVAGNGSCWRLGVRACFLAAPQRSNRDVKIRLAIQSLRLAVVTPIIHPQNFSGPAKIFQALLAFNRWLAFSRDFRSVFLFLSTKTGGGLEV